MTTSGNQVRDNVARSGEIDVTGIGYRPDGELLVGGRPLEDGPLLDEHGEVRITDFGIAALASELDRREMSGTPAYMSPEQLEGQELTVKSDIYSLGLLLYELFTGKRAFDASTLSELIELRRSDSTPTTPTC